MSLIYKDNLSEIKFSLRKKLKFELKKGEFKMLGNIGNNVNFGKTKRNAEQRDNIGAIKDLVNSGINELYSYFGCESKKETSEINYQRTKVTQAVQAVHDAVYETGNKVTKFFK